MSIKADEQRSAPGTIISLYSIDASAQGGSLYSFVPGPFNGERVSFGGHIYTPTPINIDGIAYGGEGAPPRPSLTISKQNRALVFALLGADNLRGATVRRLRTLSQYLDGQPGADPSRHWPVDIYRIEQISKQDRTTITWQLASPLDFDNKKLPGGQVLRDVCRFRYRRYDSGERRFDYGQVLCPYTEARYFDGSDAPVTDPTLDKCSRRLSGCLARYPNRQVPFGGFVGVARVRR